MRILVSWLKDFVDVTDAPEQIGHTLSMRGFELGALEPGAKPDDSVLDFEILANRPDCLSVIGLAREAATAYRLPLKSTAPDKAPASPPPAGAAAAPTLTVSLEAPDLCPRYSAAVVDVTIAPSPAWLAERLQAAGIRPINNIVDVTNYVLIELGQPMHAFDLAKLAGGAIRIRRATKGEKITTLDGTERALDPEMLVIADGQRAQAVAGVMGGGLSEVSAGTQTIVLESACFQPKSVRLTGKRIGLKTEASARFERGADIAVTVKAIERACALIAQIGAGTRRGAIIDEYPTVVEPKQLVLRATRIARVLGKGAPDADVERILTSLGFEMRRIQEAPDSAWGIAVPTFRVDVTREVDLIEEVGRHVGYDGLPTTFPALDTPPPAPDPRIDRDRTVRRVLLAAGCSEAVTFSFISPDAAAPFADAAAIVPISNPLTTQFAVLRPSLLPGLITALAHNRHRERPDVSLFETGAAITRSGQDRRVAVVWTGEAAPLSWDRPRRAVDFFDVKGLVERIAEAFHLDVTFETAGVPSYLVRGRAAVVRAGDHTLGVVGLLATDRDVYALELSLDSLSEALAASGRGPLTFQPLPRYPSISRDISIVVDESLPAATVRGTIRSAAPDTLVSVREFDRYQGKGVPDGRISLSLRLTFRSQARTLTDSEIEAAMKDILGALHAAHSAVQR